LPSHRFLTQIPANKLKRKMQSTSFNLIFDPSEDAAIHWAARTGLEHALDLRTAEQLYTRALPYMKNWAWALAAKHGWTEEAVDTVGDMPLAVW
jgi:hypothetical protein